MSARREDLIRYRLRRAQGSLDEARVMADTGHWNAYVSRLYYACFYAVSALLLQNELSSKKHSGVRSLFNRHFINKGVISKSHGAFYNQLFAYRHDSDYQDYFEIDQEEVKPWLKRAERFISEIARFLDTV